MGEAMTWEERMAQKAATRKAIQDAIERQADSIDWERQQEEWIAEYASRLTVDQAREEQRAVEKNPVGCACIGGPVCCRIRYEARKRVLA
jgi:hypothetical protein